MAERSWEELEQPILEAVAELERHRSTGLADIVAVTGLSAEQVKVGVSRLLPSDLLEGKELRGSARLLDVHGLRLLPKGRQAVDQWPSSDPAEAFLQVLAQRIAVEEDPEERGRLEKLWDSAGQVGKGVTAGVITAVVQQVSGLR
jgi:hypothetical protein